MKEIFEDPVSEKRAKGGEAEKVKGLFLGRSFEVMVIY